MQYDEFVERVEAQLGPAHLDPYQPGQAKLAINATLTTLGERISGGEVGDLASQLPEPLKTSLSVKSEDEAGDFSVQEFYRRVAEREEADLAVASIHASAVVRTLREAVTGGEVDDIRSQLPEEFAPLFG